MEVGAHEFRSPLNIILNKLTVLKYKFDNQSQEIRDLAKEMEEQAYRAKQLLDNALTFDIPVAYNFQESHLGSLFQSAAQEFTARAAERKIHIVVKDSAKYLPKIYMDSERIAQVITNLLDNAVKYSFKGENIYVTGTETASTVKFSIESRGTGIPEKFRDTIYEPFKRKVVEDKTRFIAGTGLGLPITKQIINMHKGNVNFTSVSFLSDLNRQEAEYGHIVTFIVELPKIKKL